VDPHFKIIDGLMNTGIAKYKCMAESWKPHAFL